MCTNIATKSMKIDTHPGGAPGGPPKPGGGNGIPGGKPGGRKPGGGGPGIPGGPPKGIGGRAKAGGPTIATNASLARISKTLDENCTY